MTQQSSSAIHTTGLTKFYTPGKPPALTDLTLTVNQGEIFGYLGPNGAGKTTTIKLLLDLIRPTRGSASVLGMDSQKQGVEARRRIGFLPGELNLWDGLTARQVIAYLGGLRGKVDWSYVNALAERLQFDPTKKVRSYSSGNKRKLGLIVALMHKADLLILDEPTNGLDPLMQQIFLDLMMEVRREGRTVFLSSHVLSEVQAICDRVAIIRNGQLQTVDRVDALTHVNFRWVSVRTASPVPAARLAGVPGVADVSVNGDPTTLKFRLTGDIDPVLKAFSGEYIADIRTQEASLEEIFLKYYGNAAETAMTAGKEAVR